MWNGRTILGVCVALYIGSVLIGFDTYSSVCISAAHITHDWQGAPVSRTWAVLISSPEGLEVELPEKGLRSVKIVS